MTFLNAYMFYLKGCYDNSYTQKSLDMYNIYIQRRFQDFSQGGPTFPHKTTKMKNIRLYLFQQTLPVLTTRIYPGLFF